MQAIRARAWNPAVHCAAGAERIAKGGKPVCTAVRPQIKKNYFLKLEFRFQRATVKIFVLSVKAWLVIFAGVKEICLQNQF